MKYKRLLYISVTATLLVTLSSCYQTKSIPEGEYLYAGIKELAYGHEFGQEKKSGKDSTGVIIAGYKAYNTVASILKGDASALEKLGMNSLQENKKQFATDATASETAKTEVKSVISYAPNGSIMGSSKITQPVTIGLWVWNRYVYSNGKFGKWMLNTFSSSPKYISTVSPQVRCQVASNVLRNYGFFHAKTIYRLEDVKNPKKKKISYQVLPGELFHFDSIEYRPFGICDSLIQVSRETCYFKKGDPFSAAALSNEQTKISTLLRDNGYYYFKPEYVAFQADTIQEPLKVQLRVMPSPKMPEQAKHPYYLGNTTITVLKNGTLEPTDSLTFKGNTMRWSGAVKAKLTKKNRDTSPLRFSAMRKYIYYQKGDLYDETVMNNVVNRLSSMGIFSQVQMNYAPRDTSAHEDTLDIQLTATLGKPYDSQFEGKVVGKTNGLVGPGLSYSLTKHNAFRGAESLTFGANASYEWQTGANLEGDNSLLNSWQLGANLTLSYPRFMFMGMGRNINRHLTSTTDFKIDSKWENRAGYYGMVSVGGRAAWTFKKQSNMFHEFTPFHLEYRLLTHTTDRFDQVIVDNPALKNSLSSIFVPSMEYSFSWTSPKAKYNTSSLSLNLKESGNLTSCIYAICGESFSKQGKTLFNVPFAQFIKADLNFTQRRYLTARSLLVFHGRIGYLRCFGNSTDAPYSDLFYVGGANSIRAFAIRSIGPGAYAPEEGRYAYLDEVGNIIFEANIEYRFPIISNLNGAVFIDAGNVWMDHDDGIHTDGVFKWKNFGKQLALGTGVGLRYDLDVLVVRFDVGYGLHAPYDTGKSGYFNMPSFKKSWGFHLAIGYPF